MSGLHRNDYKIVRPSRNIKRPPHFSLLRRVIAGLTYPGMEASELIELRKSLGWSQTKMARCLEVSRSRYIDYEAGFSRGHPGESAAIPLKVALAARYLSEHPDQDPKLLKTGVRPAPSY